MKTPHIKNSFAIKVKALGGIREFHSAQDVQQYIHEKRQSTSPTDKESVGEVDCRFIVGAGTNLLFLDDYAGEILHSQIKGIEQTDSTLRVGSGETWDDVVEYAVWNGLGGLECLSLIPGEVGAAAVQNIGAYGDEVADVIEKVEAVNLHTGDYETFSRQECDYAYRHSRFKKEQGRYFITHVTLTLRDNSVRHANTLRYNIGTIGDIAISELRKKIIDIRREKLPDPAEYGNAGSFFMNPLVDAQCGASLREKHPDIPIYKTDDEKKVKLSAAWLIDMCGWKGRTMGRAGVWEKQPLVLVNLGGANSSEITALAAAIQQDVKERFEIDLKREVAYIQ